MIRYRFANKEDNQQLIRLTANTGMAGETSLRIDRNPDFFKLLDMRGETRVFVAVDEDEIVGCICVSFQQVYVGGEILPLQYIGDFKVAAAYRNKGIGLQLCNEMADHVISNGAHLAFLNVSKGNTKPLSFFKDRPNIPDFENIGSFIIHQLIGRKRKKTHAEYKIEATSINNELIGFLQLHYRTYELGPVITEEKLAGTDIFIIRKNDEIIAAICLSDTMDVKQNVVTSISWKTKWLLKFMNAFSKVSGISKMPVLNEPVRMMYIKYLAVKDLEKKLLELMIGHARNIVYEKAYSFVSIGLHEKDPLNKYFAGSLKLSFRSVGMLLSIKDNKALIEKIKKGIPFEDYSLV